MELAMEWHLVDFFNLEFLKNVDHLITYQSGGSCIQVEYIFFYLRLQKLFKYKGYQSHIKI